MKVVVAVLSYNRLDLWRRTVDSLYRTSYPFDLVLYDNGSTDGTEREVAARGGACDRDGVHWIGYGFLRSVEMALESKPELVVFSADDYEYRRGWLEHLSAFWQAAPSDMAIVSCCLEPEHSWFGSGDGIVEANGERVLLRKAAGSASWTFSAKMWPVLSRMIRADEHTFDIRVCGELRELGYRIGHMDLAEHIGAEQRMWTHKPIPSAPLVDKAKWGLW